MMRPRRISLAVKVNVMLIVLVLFVSTVLIMISERAYREASFKPYIRKLEKITVQEDTLRPGLRYLIPYLNSEKLNRILAVEDAETRASEMQSWLMQEPSPRSAPYTMLDEWMGCDLSLYATMQYHDLSSIKAVVEKDGKGYLPKRTERAAA